MSQPKRSYLGPPPELLPEVPEVLEGDEHAAHVLPSRFHRRTQTCRHCGIVASGSKDPDSSPPHQQQSRTAEERPTTSWLADYVQLKLGQTEESDGSRLYSSDEEIQPRGSRPSKIRRLNEPLAETMLLPTLQRQPAFKDLPDLKEFNLPVPTEKLAQGSRRGRVQVVIPKLSTVPEVENSEKKEKPSFLKPLSAVISIAIGEETFAVYWDFLEYYAPHLAKACRGLSTNPTQLVTPKFLESVDGKVFGLLVQWMYTESLSNSNPDTKYQQRLMDLWILAKKWKIPTLQNDCLDMLEKRRKFEDRLETKKMTKIYEDTVSGDALRRYLVDACVVMKLDFMVDGPDEFIDDVLETRAAGLVEKTLDMKNYHVED